MKKGILSVLVILSFLSIFPFSVHADMGPKPSVAVRIVNAPSSDYYVTLLSYEQQYGPWSKVEADEHSGSGDEDLAFAFFASFEDEDGFCFQGNMSAKKHGDDEFVWSYFPPEKFKVLIYVPSDGTFYLSEAKEREAFNSYYVVDCSYPTLNIEEEVRIKDRLLNFALRVVLTILVELFIAWIMGYRKKKEIILILIVNIITQIILNGLFTFIDYYDGLLTWVILLPIGELIVFVVELIVYLIAMKGHKKLKTFFYTLLANTLSAALTLFGLLFSAMQ